MKHSTTDILCILDQCCDAFTFPVLDNGYVDPAATRLSLFRSESDWAMVIEVFGFSPRSGLPDTQIQTFGSRLKRQKVPGDFVHLDAYESYLSNNPHNESVFVFPMDEGDWQSPEDGELVASGCQQVSVRGRVLDLPNGAEYQGQGIELQSPPQVHVYELCRLLAALDRQGVLATSEERRKCVPEDVQQIMQIEEWHHPDVVNGERPSASTTFKLFADVLLTGDPAKYQPVEAPNTHWSHWPDGGTL